MSKPDRLTRIVEQAIPTNWCDPLLTGNDRVIHGPPYDGQDIERLLLALKTRLLRALKGKP